ncbi:Guanosine-3',5'-bis(diphosphate) 3'-pyrophosphohydrolase / GTP pyrophosphokinase, (p)ppGpp synthetase II [hydrothermal vent metagenome]|uniref:Guanosine-3',5'-bis(Diphosphate) 3'-pyrophosphohydrolase / GTP pyrophosphokinase, (P)ppGpp synthetase II n=1 Tax=hydrothermal vent metagenome TaxID=652676 RepID=A0A3B1DDH7_9ZZZZ
MGPLRPPKINGMLRIQDLTDAVLEYHPEADIDVILDAYLYSAKAHRGQSRKSGEAYISHPIEVAYNLTRLKMDEQTVAAGLLHDTIEDTLSTPEEIKDLFGDEIYHLVEGVTKISKMEFSSREETQAENYRKMILAMAKDIRVILIKLADRAHNIQTLESLSEERQRRIARETLDIFAPLANRLGIGWMRAELENGAFKYLYPNEYSAIVKKVAKEKDQRDYYVENVCSIIGKELAESGLKGGVAGRSKHIYSIYQKMVTQNIGFEDVYDLIGVRVLTDSVKDCYAVLGLIHSVWTPIPGKFKDYIAMPKPNRYKSLHTTVIGPKGGRVEVQIRTHEMHKICEEGIAAHWQYKEQAEGKKKNDNPLQWVRHLLEHQQDLKNPKEFLNAFKVNLFSQEVYVFSPDGDVYSLPHGATPVDFAYAIHTDIGDHCTTAKVDGKIVPLRFKLRNGNRVEIVTSKNRFPNRDWLAFVKTSKARSRISHHINSQEQEQSLALGRELLEKEIHGFDYSPGTLLKGKVLEEAIQACGYNSLDNLLVGVGLGKVSILSFVHKLLPKEKQKKISSNRIKLKEKVPQKTKESAIKVKCFNDDILLRVGKCCNPLPGDPIFGYITRGRGVTVHHIDCPGIRELEEESERLVEVEWDTGQKTIYPTKISIVTEDKPGLLASISNALAECQINIVKANVKQGPNKRAFFDFSIEIEDLTQLNRTLERVQQVEGVILVERVKEYKKKSMNRSQVESGGGDKTTGQDLGLLVN